MIKKLGKNNWKEWKEIRLEALKNFPDNFLSSKTTIKRNYESSSKINPL